MQPGCCSFSNPFIPFRGSPCTWARSFFILETPEIYREVRRKHGADWITLGDILHVPKSFPKISLSLIKFTLDDIIQECERLCKIKNISYATKQIFTNEIIKQYETIKNSDIATILLPQSNSYSELPFITKQGGIIYSGRIDRIIIKNNVLNIYDYKTFPIQEDELAVLAENYRPQLALYQKAASELFTLSEIRTYLIFTFLGKIYNLT